MKLDLGSGPTPVAEDFIGADLCGTAAWDEAKPGQVGYVNLREFHWPWPDDSVDEVFCAHYVCHQSPAEWVRMVDELFRVLVDGGLARFIYPNLFTGRAWQDPTYLDHIPLERWSYADKAWRNQMGVTGAQYPSCDFELAAFSWTGLHDRFHARADDVKVFATSHYVNAAADCSVLLKARKSGTPDKVNPKGVVDLGIAG